jgi:hypothetical protein
MKNKIFLMFTVLLVSFTSCTNDDVEFDDFDYQTVYFAYQFPVRTLTLGEDIFDTSLDNEYKCRIMATLGGVYSNDKDVTINIQTDNSLTAGLAFSDSGNDIVAMPSNYYTLLSDKIVIAKGQVTGGVDVQLTDAYFADPLSITKNYVIPVKMTNVVNADSILSGKPLISNPNRAIAGNWAVVPKDYIFYAVKYINQWDGNYLRRGKDVIVGNGGNTSLDKTVVRHKTYVESDEVFKINTLSLTAIDFPVVYKDAGGNNINCKLILSFDNAGNCTVSSSDPGSYTATGTGKFVKKGEKNSWGSKDRDALYLEYKVNLQDFNVTTNDTLVLRDRGVKIETFTPVLK